MRHIFFILSSLIIGFLCFQSFHSRAQSTNDPLSQYGAGRIITTESIDLQPLFGTNYSRRSIRSFSLQNPASLGSLELTVFSFAAQAEYSDYNYLGDNYTEIRSNFNYFALGFPISVKEGIGASVGVTPVTNMEYEYTVRGSDEFRYNDIYEGEGGLNRIFIGAGWNITKKLSIGFQGSYVFGSYTRDFARYFDPASVGTDVARSSDVINSAQASGVIKEANVDGLSFEGGLQFHTELNDKYSFHAGFSGRLSQNLNVDFTNNYISYELRGFTLEQTQSIEKESSSQNATFPAELRLGFMLQNENHWQFGIGGRFGQWSEYQGVITGEIQEDFLEAGASLNWIPDYDAFKNGLAKINYRFGFNYAQTNLVVAGDRINDMTFSYGMGIPIRRNTSSLDLAILAGSLFSEGDVDLTNNYIKLSIGVTLSDKWFLQRKID